jgi:hypothetical protein
VALKVLPDATMADSQQVLRFQREARLHHTNIIPVFGWGRSCIRRGPANGNA